MTSHRNTIRSDAGYQSLPQGPEVGTLDYPSTEELEVEVNGDDTLVEGFVVPDVDSCQDPRIRWIHFILGCAVLLPWNAIITATPFFLSRLEGSSLKSTFSSYLSTSFTVVNFFVLGHATATSHHSNTTRRAYLSIFWLTALTLLFTLSTFIHTPPGWFFSFVLLNGVAQASAGSYLQTSIVAVASLLGPSAIQAMMSGQAAVGVAVSFVQVISAAASVRKAPSSVVDESEPEESSAFAFFSLSTIFLVLSAVSYAWLTRLPAYTTVMNQFSRMKVAHGDEQALEDAAAAHPFGSKYEQMRRVVKANAIHNFAVAYVFVVTLAVFPPITISILPTNPATHPLLFSSIHFLVFNIGDFCGRYSCSFPRLIIWSANRLLTLSLARTLFIPIFLMCNLQSSGSSSLSTPIISSDILYMLILLLFGFSNGYVSSLCMMSAPSVEHNPRLRGRVEDVDVAATVASFFLVGGLAVGSLTSFAVRAAVCNCNPFHE